MVESNHTVGPPHPQTGNSKVSSNTTGVGLRSAHRVVQGPRETRNDTDNSQKHSAERPIQEHLLCCSDIPEQAGIACTRENPEHWPQGWREWGCPGTSEGTFWSDSEPQWGSGDSCICPNAARSLQVCTLLCVNTTPKEKDAALTPVSSAHAEVLREYLLRYRSDGQGVFTFPTQW